MNADFRGFCRGPPRGWRQRDVGRRYRNRRALVEDSSGDPTQPLYEFELSVDRVRAAREAIDASETGVVLTGRSEGFVVGQPDIDETIRRLRAYGEAGADCLYAPRISSVEHVVAILEAVSPKPVNLLINAPFITVAEAAHSVSGASASVARSRVQRGAGSCRQLARSRTRGRSPSSRVCPTSKPCSANEPATRHACPPATLR